MLGALYKKIFLPLFIVWFAFSIPVSVLAEDLQVTEAVEDLEELVEESIVEETPLESVPIEEGSNSNETREPALETSELILPENLSHPIVVGQDAIFLEVQVVNINNSNSYNESDGKYLYQDVFTNTDLEYQETENGLKESIILKSTGHPTDFKYKLNLDQFDFVQTSPNTIALYKKGKSNKDLFKLYTLSAPLMYGNDGQESTKLVFTIQDNILTLTPDAEWLATASYPVVVDPTIEITVLNVHSYPVQGDLWNVDFTTVGTADLTIAPADQATIDEDQFT